MAIRVAEYLGVRTDTSEAITPIKINSSVRPTVPCPFKNSHCDKAKKGLKPICSIRDDSTNKLWIVCSSRLCAIAPKAAPLNDYQKQVLRSVAKAIFDEDIQPDEVLVKREVPIKVTADSDYSADFVMWRRNPKQTSPFNPDRAAILEMQGGGEITNTGKITNHISA